MKIIKNNWNAEMPRPLFAAGKIYESPYKKEGRGIQGKAGIMFPGKMKS